MPSIGQDELDLALALARRQNRYEEGLERLRQRYPDAPDALLRSAAFHLYGELVGAFIGALAQIERSLRGSQDESGEPQVSDSAYHLYNWLQLQAILPWARSDFFAELGALKDCLSADDVEGARELIDTMMQQFEGSSPPPMPDFP